MGVAGCGKTTIGSKLARSLGVLFLDADDFHPEANLKKMSSGTPLDDSDRIPWLEILREELRSNRGCVLACSALKQNYRSMLQDAGRDTVFIMLDISKETARRRLLSRANHFMPETLIDSQFDSLERPTDALVVDAEAPVNSVLDVILRKISGGVF
tara:strand:- start:93 stop:560 length:468 start_codon:yes stop_codon:yes gene_type:complete